MPGNGSNGGGAAVRATPASRQNLTVEALANLVPKSGSNSRAFYARDGLQNGTLSTQAELKSFDFSGFLNKNRGMSGKMINVLARNGGGVIKVGDGASTELKPVTQQAYRTYMAQVNRDMKTLWQRADSSTRDTWARDAMNGGVSLTASSARNPVVKAITKDLARRAESMQ